MAGLDELIGSKISLISQQDIRYEGTLYSINAEASSIILRGVKCYGTEDRVTEADKQVAPLDGKDLAFVSFPGSEIKDLFVHEEGETKEGDDSKVAAPAPPAAKPVTEAAQPPAPPRQQQQQHNNNGGDKPRRNNNNNSNGQGKPAWADRGDRNQGSDRNRDGNYNNNRNRDNRDGQQRQNNRDNSTRDRESRPQRQNNAGSTQPQAAAGTGQHLLHLRERQNVPGAGPSSGEADASTSAAEIKKTEFDFQAALTSFKKVTVDSNKAEVAQGNKEEGDAAGDSAPMPPMPEVKPYVKDDFFDSFCAPDKAQEGPRYNAAAERNLNKDTFGATSLQSNYRRYNNRGGNSGRGYSGGGGGRGRGGGGRGRGYYNNNNSNGNGGTTTNA